MSIDLTRRRISILGAGRTGMASAMAIIQAGGVPFVSDSGEIRAENRDRLGQNGIEFESGGHSNAVFDCDMLIVSPGVPANSNMIRKAKSLGITIWPEIELAFRMCEGRIIAVTGSNGKTTTTALIGEMLNNAGYYCRVCGNIGNPFIGIAAEIPADGYAVVELSSFQLELIEKFRPNVAVMLNITPDHLDRHGDFDTYAGAKLRIFENQDKDDFSIVNFDDDYLKKRGRKLKSKTIWFSVESDRAEIYADPGGGIYINRTRLMSSDEVKIRGMHNLWNACAAVGAANSVGIANSLISDTLKNFAGVEHRLEFVRLIGGVSFINDSKGTNVDSVYWALKAVSAPVILIAGGRDKAGDFTRLNDLVREKVKEMILIGEAAGKMEKTWHLLTRCKTAVNMREAVSEAFKCAREGDTVLLSPACASFDMYNNFEERGRDFKAAVMALN
jgi:UDP-N-acetylmuramoylalanine--D-glutamate ligase